jgi:hypothetical protein
MKAKDTVIRSFSNGYAVFVVSFILFACSSPQTKHEDRKVKPTEPAVNEKTQGDSVHRHQQFSDWIPQNKTYLCDNPESYQGKKIGTGHCVSLIQTCSGAPFTSLWRQGPKVKGLILEPGTIIATFRDGKYPNVTGWHAAIYISQDEKGIWVWDQWVGKAVHKRFIRFKNGKGTPNNDGDAYSVVYQ